jgi:hypothetical protein
MDLLTVLKSISRCLIISFTILIIQVNSFHGKVVISSSSSYRRPGTTGNGGKGNKNLLVN